MAIVWTASCLNDKAIRKLWMATYHLYMDFLHLAGMLTVETETASPWSISFLAECSRIVSSITKSCASLNGKGMNIMAKAWKALRIWSSACFLFRSMPLGVPQQNINSNDTDGHLEKPESGTEMETWGLTSAFQQRCVPSSATFSGNPEWVTCTIVD